MEMRLFLSLYTAQSCSANSEVGAESRYSGGEFDYFFATFSETSQSELANGQRPFGKFGIQAPLAPDSLTVPSSSIGVAL
jgi:hypothetical protein